MSFQRRSGWNASSAGAKADLWTFVLLVASGSACMCVCVFPKEGGQQSTMVWDYVGIHLDIIAGHPHVFACLATVNSKPKGGTLVEYIVSPDFMIEGTVVKPFRSSIATIVR